MLLLNAERLEEIAMAFVRLARCSLARRGSPALAALGGSLFPAPPVVTDFEPVDVHLA